MSYRERMRERAGWYSTTEAVRLTGASYRQLDYWCRIGLIGPTVRADGEGSARSWSVADVDRAALIVRLAAVGVDVAHVRRVGGPERAVAQLAAFLVSEERRAHGKG